MEYVTGKDFQFAVTIILAIVIGKIITLLVDTTYNKAVNNQYITKSDCNACKMSISERRSEVGVQIRIIKGLLLVVAVKLGVSDEQLKDLFDT
jgi:hypothetical protein